MQRHAKKNWTTPWRDHFHNTVHGTLTTFLPKPCLWAVALAGSCFFLLSWPESFPLSQLLKQKPSMQYLSVTKILVFCVPTYLLFSHDSLLFELLSLLFVKSERSHLPVESSPLFVWLQQKIALCHSAFAMIVLFSTAICAQWVILTIVRLCNKRVWGDPHRGGSGFLI